MLILLKASPRGDPRAMPAVESAGRNLHGQKNAFLWLPKRSCPREILTPDLESLPPEPPEAGNRQSPSAGGGLLPDGTESKRNLGDSVGGRGQTRARTNSFTLGFARQDAAKVP